MIKIKYIVRFKVTGRFAKCSDGFLWKRNFSVKKEADKFYNMLKRFLTCQKRDENGFVISMGKEEEDWGLGGLCICSIDGLYKVEKKTEKIK